MADGTVRASSVEITFQRGMCRASVNNGKFRVASLMDREAGFVICRSLGDVENLLQDIQAVMADVHGELGK